MSPDELKEARTKLGMSQRKLATALDVRQNSVRKWESALTPIDLRTSLAVHMLLFALDHADAAQTVTKLQERAGVATTEEEVEE